MAVHDAVLRVVFARILTTQPIDLISCTSRATLRVHVFAVISSFLSLSYSLAQASAHLQLAVETVARKRWEVAMSDQEDQLFL